MADFKKLSDVEVVAEPAESANVLIEENGVIKRTPKTAVNGVVNTEYDLVLETSHWDVYDLTNDAISVISGSAEVCFNKIKNLEAPKVLLQIRETYGDEFYSIFDIECHAYTTQTNDEVAFVTVLGFAPRNENPPRYFVIKVMFDGTIYSVSYGDMQC